MSTFKVPLTKILEINPHPNADKLILAKVYDYDVVVSKDSYNVGDYVFYVPVGSILPAWLEELLFPVDSKIKLTKSKIRAIKIRGFISQGMLINPSTIPLDKLDLSTLNESMLDSDFSEKLEIKKYIEQVKSPRLMKVSPLKNIYKVREFKEYTDIEHGKYYDRNVLTTDEPVIITQKLHGTSARYGWFKKEPVSLFDRILKFFNLLPEWQFCWGSRRCQIQATATKSHAGFKSEEQGVEFGDVYTKIAKQEALRGKIPKGYAVYGEIVGHGIQKNYMYGLDKNEHAFYVYDVMKDGKWLDYDEQEKFCDCYDLTMVPKLYTGPFRKSKVEELLPVNVISKDVNEGVVVRPLKERHDPTFGRVILKYINPEYLLKDTTEFQ